VNQEKDPLGGSAPLTPALAYHSSGRPGKIEVIATKPCLSAEDLSLAYTPGVAEPVLEIDRDPGLARRYTARGNLVAVVSNGTAILGLGDRGALAAKPVMEGKGVLFKRFADIDVFDLELNTKDPEKVIETVKILEPTFGGINLEDIKAPECFEIERRLIEELSIPVFHDDQHGTAIIATAALINAALLTNKKLSELWVVINGAGAAGISCGRMFKAAGVAAENIIMCDSQGVICPEREGILGPEKREFITMLTPRTLEEAVRGADVFIGVSRGDCLTREMVRSMAPQPVIFAMANPTPEIGYEEAVAARDDLIMATGRSDYPNQINNVLGFPYIFRGALDVEAGKISEGMKMAAALALAELARQPVPEEVRQAYEGREFSFGRDYIVPKPFDPRILEWESAAVAQAACEEGLAASPITDWAAYRKALKDRTWKK
jgi:malate dehydrogenase (oxaloacetate-decarboxylating)(NADP+)